MEGRKVERKLAAILYADVAGYSRLTGEDEAGTHRILSTYLDAMTVSIERHGGKVEHFAGDAVLADFTTVFDALSCAVDIQRDLNARNSGLSGDRKLKFRIGINLGDVIVDRNDIYGDGVNVAARLESLAEPGGICLSEAVRAAVGNKLPLAYEFMGVQTVKNIAEPVRVYRVHLDPSAAPRMSQPKRKRWRMIAMATGMAIAVVSAAAIWKVYLRGSAPQPEVASETAMAFPLPAKPSIAVLPFNNLSGDPEQDYFSDGITNDLITDLSKLSDLFVIASNSVFTYKGRAVKVQEVSRDLGVRYVLEGSIQKAGARVRINAQLIEATTGHHLWAERYDRQLQDIFTLQDEVAQQIVTALALKLTEEERKYLARQYTNDYDAYNHFLRGQAFYAGHTKEDNELAREMFQKAIELDPAFARAYGTLALAHADDFRYRWSTDPAESVEWALELAQRGVALDAALPQIHWVLGYVYLYGKQQHDHAIVELEKAIALDPNYADGYALLASIHSYTGRLDQVTALTRKAMRLNPHFPSHYFTVLGRAYYLAGQFDDAITALQTAIDRNYNYLPHHVHLAATHSRVGQQDEAKWEVEQILTLDPDFSLEFLAKTYPYRDPAHLSRLMDDLRQAGLK
ncbi:MAG: adenylate/guanylate cyclase domain-containing protein [Acidiferrobacterales bacterium]